jgi:hypothetical protein
MTEKEVNDQFTAKIKKGIFKPIMRRLSDATTAEDRLQDAVASTWLHFRKHALRGEILPDGILVFFCRMRATDLRRNFVPADGQRGRDVLEPRNYHRGRVQVLRLDGVYDDQNAEGDRELHFYAEQMAANPSRKLRSAHDLCRWIGDLSHLDQHLMARKYEGASTAEIASELQMGYSPVHYRIKRRGLELAQRAGVRIGSRKDGRRPSTRHREIDEAVRQADVPAAGAG